MRSSQRPNVSLYWQNENVQIANAETTDLEDVRKISRAKLFICDVDPKTRNRYAFSIEELEDYTKKMGVLQNFYTSNTFSLNDLRYLSARSQFLREHINSFLVGAINAISPQTLQKMEIFITNCAYDSTKDRHDAMMARYSEKQLAAFKTAGVDVADLVRGEVFNEFKEYYKKLSPEEKKAIDNFPGVQKALKTYSLGDTLENIFKIKGDTCLGGTAGICQHIINAVKLAREIQEGKGLQLPLPEENIHKPTYEEDPVLKDKIGDIKRLSRSISAMFEDMQRLHGMVSLLKELNPSDPNHKRKFDEQLLIFQGLASYSPNLVFPTGKELADAILAGKFTSEIKNDINKSIREEEGKRDGMLYEAKLRISEKYPEVDINKLINDIIKATIANSANGVAGLQDKTPAEKIILLECARAEVEKNHMSGAITAPKFRAYEKRFKSQQLNATEELNAHQRQLDEARQAKGPQATDATAIRPIVRSEPAAAASSSASNPSDLLKAAKVEQNAERKIEYLIRLLQQSPFRVGDDVYKAQSEARMYLREHSSLMENSPQLKSLLAKAQERLSALNQPPNPNLETFKMKTARDIQPETGRANKR